MDRQTIWHRIWIGVRWLIGFVVAFAAWMTQVAPDEAAAKACTWFVLYTGACPEWVNAANIPRWTPVMFYGIAAVLFAFLIWPLVTKWRCHSTFLPFINRSALTIIIGHDGPYVETNSTLNAVNIFKTVNVGVRNTGNTHLSNCKLTYEAIGESRIKNKGEPEQWLREGPFDLYPGKEKRLSLAYYNEQKNPDAQPDAWIRLSGAPGGTFWSPPMLPASGGAVTLLATSDESPQCEVSCKLSVKDGTLKWERA